MKRRFPVLVGSALLAISTACPAGDDGSASDGSTSSDATTSAEEESADSTTGEPIGGEELFLQLCAPCHGPEGQGTALGYALQHPVRDYSTWVVRNGRPAGNPELSGSVMIAYSSEAVSDAQLAEIWDYLDSFPQPTTGEGLYLDYCRNCHGEDALGGVTDQSLLEAEALAGLFEQVREGDNVGNYGLRTEAMPVFDQSRLSDAEVQLIADYLASL